MSMLSRLRALFVITGFLSSFGTTASASDEGVSLTPRQQAIEARLEAWETAQRNSSDLRLRILDSTALELLDDRRPDLGIRIRELIPASTLFEQSRGSTDPLLLDLLVQRCSVPSPSPSPCDRLDVARRWVTADTQNQLAWLTLSMVQKQQGALDDSRSSFVRASQASQWHGHYIDVARLRAGTIPGNLSPQERGAALLRSISRAGVHLPFGQLQVLGAYCKESDVMREACLRIVAVMVRDADSVMELALASRYAARAGADRSTIDAYQQKADAVQWAGSLDQTEGSWLDDMELDDDASRRLVARLEATIALGEVRFAERVLAERHLREVDAAKAFVAKTSALRLRAAGLPSQ